MKVKLQSKEDPYNTKTYFADWTCKCGRNLWTVWFRSVLVTYRNQKCDKCGKEYDVVPKDGYVYITSVEDREGEYPPEPKKNKLKTRIKELFKKVKLSEEFEWKEYCFFMDNFNAILEEMIDSFPKKKEPDDWRGNKPPASYEDREIDEWKKEWLE